MKKTLSEVVVTPNMAEQLMLGNTKNRPLRLKHVQNLAKEMHSGRWRLTHQALAITPDGVVLDGQHRLAAVVRAGVSVLMLIDYAADPDTFSVIDTGKPRIAADVLHIHGMTSSTRRVAIIRSAINGNKQYTTKVSNAIIAVVAGRYGNELDAIIDAWHGVPAPIVACVFNGMVAKQISHESCARIGEKFTKQLWLSEDDAMRRLWFAAKRLSHGIEGRSALYRMACAALTADKSQRPVKILREQKNDWAGLPWDDLE
jgi:hypothetical protein